MFLHHPPNDTVPTSISHRIPSPLLPEKLAGEFLPEDLVTEILLRLPVKSLLQFKRVCKSWKTLISDPQFANTHLQIKTTNHQQLVFSVLEESRILSYPLNSLCENPSTPHKPATFTGIANHDYLIIGSCNGLLCLLDSDQRVRMCNPSIRFNSEKSPQAVSFSSNIKHHGFGYDEVNNKYKVLLVLLNRNNSSQSLTKIYTFGDDSWKTIQDFPPTRIRPFRLLGKFVSGTLNWIVENENDGGVSSNQSVILSFDLEKETYSEVLLPRNAGGSVGALYVLNNCLGACYSYVAKDIQWVAWLMKDYGDVESWIKFVIIPNLKPASFVEPQFVSGNGVVLLVSRLFSQVVLYSLNSGEFYYPSLTINLGMDLHVHRESLVLPRC
ncbi:F-box/kelch-repeat protein At3g23880-like [Vicia villosa]|uniref:F-box/kelch-repeat protein At3g23880-like n=1 Tax=Vicia villosa TaxID=3911 RepID=UPI00273CB5AA|nr:F-box/kelch-repeat protein At3g23880-like [Vicia villosa]